MSKELMEIVARTVSVAKETSVLNERARILEEISKLKNKSGYEIRLIHEIKKIVLGE